MIGWVIVALIIIFASLYYATLPPKVVPGTPQPTGNITPPGTTPPPKPIVSAPFSGRFIADDALIVLVNGTEIHKDNGQWDHLRTVTSTIKENDRVTFLVVNNTGSGGFLGEWSWNGVKYQTSPTTFPGTISIADDGQYAELRKKHMSTGTSWIWAPPNCTQCIREFVWTAIA